MGAAVGDANGDGLPDLFVTNYLREPNNLFLRSASLAVYRDQARTGRLYEPSLSMMGWGTQFLDADADGDLDLVVANGHLDDYSDDGVPYRMRTQLFVNDGRARFDEAPTRSLGPHFGQPVLGRAALWIEHRGRRANAQHPHMKFNSQGVRLGLDFPQVGVAMVFVNVEVR